MVIQPCHEGKVIGQPAKTGHGRMGMSIHQAWHDNPTPSVNRLHGPVLSWQGIVFPDRSNAISGYSHSPLLNQGVLWIHGEDRSVSDQ
jgi:hypothetical protein